MIWDVTPINATNARDTTAYAATRVGHPSGGCHCGLVIISASGDCPPMTKRTMAMLKASTPKVASRVEPTHAARSARYETAGASLLRSHAATIVMPR